jgi:hypothetical protein
VNGHPLANGKICTYFAGTSTPTATYTDVTGTIQNSNPIRLDSAGFATIYLADISYKIVVLDGTGADGTCGTGVQQWSQDNVSAYQIINAAQTIIFAGVTVFPGGQVGEVLYRNDLGRLCFFNSAWDCIPGLDTIDTFTNKTIDLTTNSLTCAGALGGTYARYNGTDLVCANIQTSDLPTTLTPNTIQNFFTVDGAGTATVGSLVKRTTNAFATVTTPLTTDTGGVVGICVANCLPSSQATIAIMSAGIACNFDATPTIAGDYVTISPTVAGDCHDAGSVYPNNQALGRVLNTGTSTLTLFPEEMRGQGGFLAYPPNTTPVTVGNTVAETIMQGIPIGAGDLNSIGRVFVVHGWWAQQGETASPTLIVRARLDSAGGTLLGTFTTVNVTLNSGGFNAQLELATVSTGAAGTLEVQGSMNWGFGGTITLASLANSAVSTPIDLTVAHTIYFTAQWSAASPSNTITERLTTAHREN